jgi:hypothetical protein
MASYIEMHKLAQNPAAVASLASFLIKLPDIDWTEWEINFLADLANRDGTEALSTRQSEKLVELRDDAKSYTKFDGFSVGGLVRNCWIARDELDEDDEAFIDRLKQDAVTSLKKRPLMTLLRCARQLGLIDGYVNINRSSPFN